MDTKEVSLSKILDLASLATYELESTDHSSSVTDDMAEVIANSPDVQLMSLTRNIALSIT